MVKTTEKFADTTEVDAQVDVLGDTLKSLRISGSLLLREAYSPPWALAIPDADGLGALLGARPGVRVVAFHLVEFGHLEITMEDGAEVVLTAGEMGVCFGGAAHWISQGGRSPCVPVEELLKGGANPYSPKATGRPPGTSLLCGTFMLRHTALNPLFTALPQLLRATLSRPGELHNLAGVSRMMAEEIDRKSLGGGYIVERLLEVLCAEAIRAHIATIPRQETGWFSGVKDPVVGRALAAIHSQPGGDWSVQRLAQNVAMSPSRFAARFSAALGESPMAYLAKWRMNLACRRLAASRLGIGQVAAEVGYDNVPAFNRAFKKHMGLPPATWRERERA